MEKAYKKLGANISLFAISSFGTKIINFFLVPLYTHCLSTAEYGTVDMLTTVIQLLIPILTLDIADAVLRFTLDGQSNCNSILFTSIRTILLGSALLLAILFIVNTIHIIELPFTYFLFIFVSFFFTSIYNSLTNYFRGREKVTDVVVAGILNTLLNGACNLIFLLKFHLGIEGYLLANVIGIFIPVLFLVLRAWKFGFLCFSRMKVDREVERQMIRYCFPLIVNVVSWWINNSLDRVFVTTMQGVDANGLLAVSYKIPSILAMFQSIFNQAWTMSAVQEFDPADKNSFLSNTYSLYGCAMSIACSVVLLLNVPLAKILYAEDFFQAWQYTGMLIVAQLFSALSVCLSGVFTAVKDSRVLAISTLAGAGINAVLNAILIACIGIQGAVIATLISNVFIWIYRAKKVQKYVTMKVHYFRDCISYILIIIQCLIGLSNDHMYLLQLILLLCVGLLYRSELVLISRTVGGKLRRLH